MEKGHFKKRNKIIKFIIIFAFFIVSLFVVDVVVGGYLEKHILSRASRDWRDSEHNFKNASCYADSDTLGFEPIWGSCGNYDINGELSKHAASTDAQKKYKILILGDSNTKTAKFDTKLEDRLNRNGTNKVSVIKIGVPSYNTAQEVELLKTRLVSLEPDMVILQFTLNDFTITPVVIKIGDEMAYFSAQGERRFLTNEFLYKNSKLYRSFMYYRLLINKSEVADSKLDNLYWDERVTAMKQAVSDFSEFVRSKNIKALVLIYPTFDKNKGKVETDEIIRILSSNNIEFIDMTVEANKFGGPEYFQLPEFEGDTDTIHPNKDWDDVVLNALIKHIEVDTKLMVN